VQVPWEYAKTGFGNGPLGKWRDELLAQQMVPLALPLRPLRLLHTAIQDTWDAEHPILFSMTCGSVPDFYEGSKCLHELLPPASVCSIYYVLPNIPFYGATFSRGTPLLSSLIAGIRQRLHVDVAPSGSTIALPSLSRSSPQLSSVSR
jgi:hypothetical protein